MPSRNIAVQREVCDALEKEKRAGESFTTVIRRLLDQKGGLEELVGAWRGPVPRGSRSPARPARRGRP